MPRLARFLMTLGVLVTLAGALSFGQDFKSYPGSKLDEKGSQAASAAAPGKESQVYMTTDAFDKVYAFYKALYNEYTMPGAARKLPSGQPLKWAFFTIDGGKDLSVSKYWMKIQRPYVGGTEGQDTRDITVIQTVRSK